MFSPIQRPCLKPRISEDFLNIFFLFPEEAVRKTTDFSDGFSFLFLNFMFVQRLYFKQQISADLYFLFI